MEDIKKEVEKNVKPEKQLENGGEGKKQYIYLDEEEVENKKSAKKELPSDRDDPATDIISPKNDESNGKKFQPGNEKPANLTKGFQRRHEQRLELDKMLSELCQGAPVSDSLSNLSTFQCQECHDNLEGWQALKRHVAKMHPHTKLAFTEAKRSISKTICHICKICSASLLCDTVFIHRHLINKHNNMYINQYRKEFGFYAPNASESYFSDKIIGNLCVYKCMKCGQKFWSEPAFSSHLRSFSHGNYTKSSNCLIRSVFHKCKLCNEEILCDKRALQRHLKYWHDNTSLKEYCKRSGCLMAKKINFFLTPPNILSLKLSKTGDNLCMFSCTVCPKRFNNSRTFKSHLRSHKPRFSKPLETFLVQGFSYQCEMCHKLLLCDRNVICDHMKGVHGISVKTFNEMTRFATKADYEEFCSSFVKDTPVSLTFWNKPVLPLSNLPNQAATTRFGNLCSFICLWCEVKDVGSWSILKRHCKIVHGCGLPYSPSLVSVARCHKCLLCPMAVLCDRWFLSNHLCVSHKTKMSEYEEKVLQMGGEILPTYHSWIDSQSQRQDK